MANIRDAYQYDETLDYSSSLSLLTTTEDSIFSYAQSNSDSTYSILTVESQKYSYGSIDPTPIKKSSEKSSVWAASANLVNAMMGTGIIGLPLALHLCGFWAGLVLFFLIAYLSCLTMHITILCGIKTNTFTLVALCENLIGRLGSRIVNFIIFFHTAGTAVSYYILLGDTLPGLLAVVFPEYPLLSERRNVVLMFGLLFTLPLSLSRSTANFAKWSALSIVFLMIMIIGVLIRVPYYISRDNRKIELEVAPISEDVFKGLAIMSLSFGCAQNLFGVYTSIRGRSAPKWLLTSTMSIGIAFFINISFAVLAYLCFGKDVQANILLNFPESDPGIRVVKLALGLFMVLTIPLCIHPCREAVMMMFGIDSNESTNKQHYFSTFGVFLLILYFGATLTSLGKIFDLIGGFSTIVLGFLLPGLAYIFLFSKELFHQAKGEIELVKEKGASWRLYLISIISVLLAIPVMYISIKDALYY